MITIWIDADSCPRMVRDFVVKFSKQLSIPVNFVANKQINAATKDYKMIICDATKDAADNFIVENIAENDMAITRDILLAERLVNKNIKTLNDRGTVFSKENIGERVSQRNFDFNMAMLGFSADKSSTYGKKEFAKFANCFDKEIHALIRIDNSKI